MPLPLIPGIAWIIVAVGSALSLLILAFSLKEAIPILSYAFLFVGIPIGVYALYRMINDLRDSKGNKK